MGRTSSMEGLAYDMNEYAVIEMVAVIVGVIFVITVATLLIILYRGGHTKETAEILKKIEETRSQLGVMEMKHDSHTRAVSSWLKLLLDRFGFLTAKYRQPKTDVKEDKFK